MLLRRVDKPALLRQLFRLGCDYSGQAVSYQKLVGRIGARGLPLETALSMATDALLG